MAGSKLTPMMAQYQRIRRSLPDDVLLFYRLGDFYELFFEDAKEAASILNVALTKRNQIPMCGVPHHAAQGYMAKLIKANKRVAIAEQTTEPQPGKIVEREVTQIITAGTIDDLTLLDDKKANYLAAICHHKEKWGLAYIDHSTGQFSLAEFANVEALSDEVSRLCASEIIFPEGEVEQFPAYNRLQEYDAYAFIVDHAREMLCDQYKVKSLDGYGCQDRFAAISAAGAILHYLKFQVKRNCDHLRPLSLLESSQFVQIDSASQSNLDLVDSKSGRKHSLLGVLDSTITPMGARLLTQWILHPLTERDDLIARQDVIGAFLEDPFLLAKSRESLKGIRDIERTMGRLSQGSGNGRDLLSLLTSLERLPDLKEDLASLKDPLLEDQSHPQLLKRKLSQIHLFEELNQLLSSAIVEEPPAQIKDGGLFKDGYSEELDSIKSASRDGKKWLAELQETERKRTGIDSLKIKFNNVFGYFIEISKAKLDKTPENYQRKQTMVNAERFITPELKEMESKILGSEERSRQLEYELFLELREKVCAHLTALQETSDALAEVDVLLSLSEVAQRYTHVRPQLFEHDQSAEPQILEIKNGRHPVLEQTIEGEQFIPNDTTLNEESDRVIILTGPNMAGKSTYIRQVALITLMAQMGAFVPADTAKIELVDRIFCRVGASDDLTKGHSTFMVEMNETALIVNNATKHSLVILDEVGRGTATYDGLSIAWAVAEHLHDEVQCRTLFATHYHELTELAGSTQYPAVANYHVAVREWNEDIIFLRQIVAGPADKSYGIQVAKLAGLPKSILSRAQSILADLEGDSQSSPTSEKELKEDSTPYQKKKKATPTKESTPSPQLDLF